MTADSMGAEDGTRPGPDFIIGGAMKAGTTSLHSYLAGRDDVFIPEGELFFFDVDDVEQHPDFHLEPRSVPDFEEHFDRYREWYLDHFRGADPSQLVGEDTTTYLASSKAPARIRELFPEVKLIFLLREPVERCYSHYWHLVRTMRVGTSFERALESYGPLIGRSRYRPQLERYFRHFDAGRILVVLFEELVARPGRSLGRVCDFLGLSRSDSPAGDLPEKNVGGGFRSVRLALWYNRVTRPARPTRHGGRMPGVPGRTRGPLLRFLDGAVQGLNSTSGGYPPMVEETRDFLTRLFRRENRGLEELLGRELDEWWEGW